MATKNDDKIKILLASIKEKKAKMGSKPRVILETNGFIPVDGGVNINTIQSVNTCVKLAAELLAKKGYYEQACEALDVECKENNDIKLIDNSIIDLRSRVLILKWNEEAKKLSAMEKKLKDLRSEDARTEDALGDIEKELDL